MFRSAGNGSLLEVMAIIYGRDLARQCIEVEGQDFDYTVRGLMALPVQTRASRNYMTVFINRRMIRSYRIQKAILEAYKNYIPQDRYPIVVLDIEMDSHLCDVNVHPSKWEIRLSKEQQLEFLIRDTLTRTLREHMQAPEVMRVETPREKVEMPQLFETPAVVPANQVREDSVEANEWRRQAALMSEQREREQIAASFSREIPQDPEVTGKAEASAVLPAEPEALIKKTAVENREGSPLTTPKPTAKTLSTDSLSDQLPEPEPLDPRVQSTEASAEALRSVPKQTFPQMQVLAQMHGKYILAQDEHALYIVDQHAAQERVHFEEVQQRFLDQEPLMQELLVPIILEGSASVAARLQEMNELLEPMHIHLENFGQNSLICRQLPAWMSEIDEQAFLQDVLDLWKDGREVRAEDLQRHRLATIACHHSIRFNRVLSLGEMQEVIEQLAHCEQPYHCPHGRPTFITITEKQLIKEFQR